MAMRWLLLIVALLLAGCRPEPKVVDLAAPTDSNGVGPGDVFILHIVGEDKLPTEYMVAPDGTVDVPYVSRLSVEGLEAQQISALVRSELIAKEIYTDPSVSVSIKAFNSKTVTVGGEVKKDGSFAYVPGMTLTDAIAKAGGMTSLSRSYKVILVRKTSSGRKRVIVDYDAINNNEIPDVPLQAGDKITVPQRAF
jgi:protein involved in polysaccharide export with SLBB domain